MSKGPARIPIGGNVTSKLTRPFITSEETVNPALDIPSDTVTPETTIPPNEVTSIPVNDTAVVPVSPEMLGQGSLAPYSRGNTTAGKRRRQQTAKAETPQKGNPASTLDRQQTSLALPRDVKKRLAIWRAELRSEGLPVTESGIMVQLARSATINDVRRLYQNPLEAEEGD